MTNEKICTPNSPNMPALKKVKRFFSIFGPGWVTGASDDDPSGIGTYSYVGSKFEFAQLWTLLFTFPLMAAVQEICARIGQVTGRGLAGVMRRHYSPAALGVCVVLLLVANTINIAADIGIMAASMQLLLPLPFFFWALVFTVTTLVLEIFVSYRLYSRYLKFLTLSLFAYVATALIVRIDWISALGHLMLPIVKFNRDFLFATVAIFGTTISPYLFFWQASTEVEDEILHGRKTIKERKGATRGEISAMRLDVIVGMLFSNLVAFFIMVTAAGVLFPTGKVIETAADAANALRPLAGDFTFALFALGVIGTGLLAIPVLAGSASYALSECFGWKSGLYQKWRKAHGFYGVITIATLIGLLINFVGIDPIQLLLWTAVTNGIVAPILLTFIVRIGNNKKIMGKWTNGMLSNTLGWFTVALMSVSAFLLFYYWK